MRRTTLFDETAEAPEKNRNGNKLRLLILWSILATGATWAAKDYLLDGPKEARANLQLKLGEHDRALAAVTAREARRDAQYEEILRRFDRLETLVERQGRK